MTQVMFQQAIGQMPLFTGRELAIEARPEVRQALFFCHRVFYACQ